MSNSSFMQASGPARALLRARRRSVTRRPRTQALPPITFCCKVMRLSARMFNPSKKFDFMTPIPFALQLDLRLAPRNDNASQPTSQF